MLVPVVLLVAFGLLGGWGLTAVVGLVLGLVLDLLATVLLLLVVTHTMSGRRLRRTDGSVGDLAARTTRLESSLAEQRTTLERQSDAARKTQTALTAAVTQVGNRLQATQNLFALVTPRGPVPMMVGYVASPDVLLLLVQTFLTRRPSLVVECGSGTSTLFLALAAQQHGVECRIVSLDHELAYAEGTRALLAEHGVGHLAEVRHAPLATTSLGAEAGPWYDGAAYEDLHDIGLAFVDGPPGDVGPQARYPMVPLLADRLAQRCVIVLDDANRADERGTAERWRTQLPGFTYRFLPLTRGAAVFTRGDTIR